MPGMIQITALYKEYLTGKRPVTPLNNINLEVPDKSFFVIRGESGSGKSTLLNIIGGLLRPTSGEVVVNSQNIENMSDNDLADYRNSVYGFIFQNYNLIPYLNALDNVVISLLLKKWNNKKAIKRATLLLEQLGLQHRLDIYPNSLSGGEQQRVAIARAIAHHPKIILADEPTGNLDEKNAREVLSMLQQIQKKEKNTVVVVSHSEEVTKHATTSLVLKEGKLFHKK